MQNKMADTENFQSSLQTVLELRSKSNDAIKTVSEGMTVKHGPENEGKEKKFLSQVKLMMDTVNSQIKDLETKANLTQQNVSSLPLGHSVYLSLDAAPESTSVYNSLFNSYQWFDKTREYSSGATSLLSQNNLSRSYQKNGRTRRRDPNKSHSAAVTSGVATPAKSVDNAIANFSRPFNDMNFQVIRPNGSQMKAIVHITLARILKATLVLKGLVIEWVIVKGCNEGGSTDSETDLWQESDYQVFRKITDNANAAMLNFSSPMYPEYGLKSFITYLHSFDTLFTDKCRKCGFILRSNCPPTWRDFKTLDPFHEDCR